MVLHLDPPVPPVPWTCPNCRGEVATFFCPDCGERHFSKRELSLRGLLEQLLRVFTRVDGRVLRTFMFLLCRPGILTTAFMNGQRKPFIGPFQIFLVANVLFFAVQSFADMKIFASTLAFRLDGQLWSEFGRQLVTKHLTQTGYSLEQYAPIFNQAVALNAKSMIGLMVPLLALLPPLTFWRTSRPLAVHVAFCLHIYAFLLLLFCVPLAAEIADGALGGDGLMNPHTDDVVSLILLSTCGGYLYCAIGPVYGARGVLRGLQALVLALATACIFLVYKFALLPITLWTT